MFVPNPTKKEQRLYRIGKPLSELCFKSILLIH